MSSSSTPQAPSPKLTPEIQEALDYAIWCAVEHSGHAKSAKDALTSLLESSLKDSALMDFMQSRYIAADFEYEHGEDKRKIAIPIIELPRTTGYSPDLRATIESAIEPSPRPYVEFATHAALSGESSL